MHSPHFILNPFPLLSLIQPHESRLLLAAVLEVPGYCEKTMPAEKERARRIGVGPGHEEAWLRAVGPSCRLAIMRGGLILCPREATPKDLKQ